MSRRAGLGEVAEQFKAWGFGVNLLRQKEDARVLTAAGQVCAIAPDADLEVVVATAETAAQEQAHEEAQQVLHSLNASIVHLEDVDAVARRAARLAAIAVFIGLAANTIFGAWWLDGVVALGIAAWAVIEGRRAWAGKSCACMSEDC